jgi:hypothetical protein
LVDFPGVLMGELWLVSDQLPWSDTRVSGRSRPLSPTAIFCFPATENRACGERLEWRSSAAGDPGIRHCSAVRRVGQGRHAPNACGGRQQTALRRVRCG